MGTATWGEGVCVSNHVFVNKSLLHGWIFVKLQKYVAYQIVTCGAQLCLANPELYWLVKVGYISHLRNMGYISRQHCIL